MLVLCKVLIGRQVLMKRDFYGQIFEKYSNIKFNGNSSSGSRVVPCGQTDGQT